MAGKATSVYVSIVKQEDHKTIERKTFFNSKGATEWINESLQKYPKPEYYYVKETY